MPIKDFVQTVARTRLHGMFDELSLFLGRSLPFNMQMQTQSNWCWAATATSVSLFYNASSGWTQCEVANAELSLSGCCNSPVPGPCNVPWFLNTALDRTDNFVTFSGPMSFADVQAQIRLGRPVGARVGWSSGGGHFMVIYGWRRIGSSEFLMIDDPIFGKSEVSVATFSGSYQGSGSWTHSYLTKRALNVFDIQPIPIPELLPEWFFRHPLPDPPAELREDARVGLAMAHRGYVLGLKELAEGHPAMERESFVRVFQVAGQRPFGFVDVVGGDEGGEVSAVSQSDSYAKAFDSALQLAERSEQLGEKAFEPRLLRVPALYTDLLWLHGDGEDVAVVISSPQQLPIGKVMSLDEALDTLRGKASEQLRAYADDPEGLKGA